jgi:tetratricopeptide (TPR) repeat protein
MHFRSQKYSLLGLLLIIALPAYASETQTPFERIVMLSVLDSNEKTLKESGEYLKTNPNDEDILMLRARLLTRVDRNAEAGAAVARALAIRPDDARALGVRGYCRIMEHKYLSAISDLERAMKFDRPDPLCSNPDLSYTNLAELYRLTGQQQLRKTALKRAANQALLEKAKNLRSTGGLDSAVKILSQIVVSDKDDFYALMVRAVCYGNKAEYSKAVEDWTTLIRRFPDCAMLYYFRADCYSEMGSKARAVADLRKVIALKPRLVAFNYIAQTGRIRDAFEPTDEKIVNLADVYFLLGQHYEDLDDPAQSRKAFDSCLALDATIARAHFERALIERKLLEGKAALGDLTDAIKYNPRYVDAFVERAKLQEQMGNPQAALADFNQVIAINSSEFGPYLLRGELYARLKNHKAALVDFDKAVSLAPSEGDCYISRADEFARAKMPEKALVDYRKALKLSPSDAALLQEKINRLGLR